MGRLGGGPSARQSLLAGLTREDLELLFVVITARIGLSGKRGYAYRVEFEWDPAKAAKNLRKHGVSFAEAATVLGDTLGVTAPDPDHSSEEDRYVTVGRSVRDRVLLVAHTERGDRIRIISARELTLPEREAYEEETAR